MVWKFKDQEGFFDNPVVLYFISPPGYLSIMTISSFNVVTQNIIMMYNLKIY